MFSLKTIIFLFAALIVAHVVATFYHLYWLFPWLDMPMHFIGGLLSAMIFFYFWRLAGVSVNAKQKFLIVLILALGFVALIGVFTEFAEFIFDFLRDRQDLFQISSADTMGDLLFDLLGALAGFALFY